MNIEENQNHSIITASVLHHQQTSINQLSSSHPHSSVFALIHRRTTRGLRTILTTCHCIRVTARTDHTITPNFHPALNSSGE
jgi:hypothetical protein